MIIVLAQTKGGVGKSTLAVNLAVERSRAGRDVLLVDADDQATAMDFTALRAEQLSAPGYTAVALSGPNVRTQVLQMQSKYADIIIDAGSRDTAGLRAALTVADIALVPFQPRSFDLWTLDKVASLVPEAKQYRDKPLRTVAVLNCADPGGLDNTAAVEALSGSDVIAYLDAPIGRRKAFPNASSEGRGVCELKRQDSKASAEMAALARFVFDGVVATSHG
ncbi:MAG: AAA family ATPase [Candidatus Binatia bacterium]